MRSVRKKILYCEGNLDSSVGGSHYSLFYLVDSLDKRLYEPIVVFHRNNRLIPMYRQAGLDTRLFAYRSAFRLPAALKLLGPVSRMFQMVVNLANIAHMVIVPGIRCAWYIRKNGIDLVHLNNTIIRNHHWMLGARLVGVPCISHERGINGEMGFFPLWFARHLVAIVCISYCVRDNLQKQGVDKRKLVVIHNGLDPDRVRATVPPEQVRQQFGIEAQWPVVAIVGNIKEWKGQDVVVRAIARVREQWPDIRCFLVGDTDVDRLYEERLRNLVDKLGLGKNVIFTGYRSNVADFLNVVDIVIHASVLPEPFGRVLLEGMAMRKPVVGANGGAVPEVVQDGVTGYVFTPGDDKDLSVKIGMLLEDRDLAKEMGNKGYRRVAEEFGIMKNVERTQAVYAALIGPGPADGTDQPG